MSELEARKYITTSNLRNEIRQDMEDINTATGIKCYFENINVNGQSKNDYSPIQKDKISNQK